MVTLTNTGTARYSFVTRHFGQRFQLDVTSSSLFKLLDLYFRFGQFGLADFDQSRAFFVLCQQGFERQIIRLHRFNDRFELLQRFLEGRIFGGTTLARAFGVVRHG